MANTFTATVGTHVSDPSEVYSHDAAFVPELDMPFEPEPAPAPDKPEQPRDPNGRFAKPGSYQHDPALVEMAKDLKFTQDEIEQTPPEWLGRRVRDVQKLTMQHLAETRKALGNPLRPSPQPSAPVQPEPEPTFDLSELHESLRHKLEYQDKEIKALKAQLLQQQQAKVNETLTEKADRFFEKVNQPKLFGKGTHEEIGLQSAEMKRRQHVFKAVGTFEAGRELAQLQEAYESIYGGLTEAVASPYEGTAVSGSEAPIPANLARHRKVWDEEGPTAVPSHRQPAPLSAEQRAARAAYEYMRDHDLGEQWRADDMEP